MITELDGLCVAAEWQPTSIALHLRQLGERQIVLLEPGVSELALACEGERRCTGYWAPGAKEAKACPDGNVASRGRQCDDCTLREMLLPCLRCTGESCRNPDRTRQHQCFQPKNHAVYLAAYAPGMIKVGVARWERQYERLAEQGARAALIVGQADGKEARLLEHRCELEGVADRLTDAEHVAAWSQKAPVEELEHELHGVAADLRRRLHGPWLPPEQIQPVALPELPALDPRPRLIGRAHELRLRGALRAIYGRTLVIDSDSGGTVALNTTALVGYRLRVLADSEIGESQTELALS